uniref:Major facilitator superfamily (MFS) profile domain-containing protein n=1 Tax=Glycine max TaxID=3847 RepID=A0A0R0K8K7_SOYBN
MDKLYGLSHLFMTVFLHNFSMFMVVPAITDVTMAALCPGQDECSLAIYITGFQQAMIGLGTLVMMPLLGNLSDKYGRKAILTLPMILTIIPVGILAYSRTKKFFYVYYVFKILISMVCEGSVPCLALAYVADNVPESGRSTVFGILSGIGSAAFVCATLSARFLSSALTFQVSTLIAVIGALYMQFFLRDSVIDDKHLYTPIISQGNPIISKVNGNLESKKHLLKALRSIKDLTSFLNSSLTINQAAIVAFFNSLADVGLHGSLLYFLKAQFHFDKNQFADLMVISGIAGTVSQVLITNFFLCLFWLLFWARQDYSQLAYSSIVYICSFTAWHGPPWFLMLPPCSQFYMFSHTLVYEVLYLKKLVPMSRERLKVAFQAYVQLHILFLPWFSLH